MTKEKEFTKKDIEKLEESGNYKMTKEKAIIDNLNNKRVATLVKKETLADCGIALKDINEVCMKDSNLIFFYNHQVKEKIQNVQRRTTEIIQMEWSKGMKHILDEILEIFNEEIGESLL